jgi:hypothetical protein
MNIKSGTLIAVFAVIAIFTLATFASAACSACQAAAAANGKLKNASQNWSQEREQIREQLTTCRNDTNKTECRQTVIVDKAKVYLGHVAEDLCGKLDTMEERVNKAEKLTDDEKASVLDAIAEAKTKCSEIQSDIDNATTRQDVKDAIREMRELVRAVKVKTIELIKERRIGLVIERAEHLETRLNRTIEKAKAANLSTDELETLVDDFNAKIAEARAAYNESRDIWTQVFEMISNNTTEGRSELVQQAHDKMQEAQADLKDAHAILKDIVAKIREMKLEVAKESETEDNDTAENETEDNETNETED